MTKGIPLDLIREVTGIDPEIIQVVTGHGS